MGGSGCGPNQNPSIHLPRGTRQGLIARLQQSEGEGEAGVGPVGKALEKREAEVVHLYETLAQGAGEAVRLLTAGDVEAPEAVLTVAQVRSWPRGEARRGVQGEGEQEGGGARKEG